MQIVDAHHHFWDLKRNYYPWLADHEETTFFLGDYSALKRNYLPDDYRCDAEGFEVVATVHVEAEWDRRRQVAETEWLHAINATHGLPNVVVGHVWLAADNCEAVLRDHMQYPLFRGVRSKPVTSLTPDTMTPGAPGTIQDPVWRKGLALLETLGLTYDLRVPYWHLDEAAEAISQHPNLPVVLNHTGFPWDRSDAGVVAWKKAMKTIAACPNVQVKLSEFGLKDAPWTIEGNRGVVLDAVEIFDVKRCMWASNFPVAGLRIGYRAQLEGMLEILKDLSPDELDQIFRRNAATFYGINVD
jgi:predicted TIM-barrel fold metal-dependent hydrolase